MKYILFLLLLFSLHVSAQNRIYADSTVDLNLFLCVTISDEDFKLNLDEIKQFIKENPVPEKRNDIRYTRYFSVQNKILLAEKKYTEYIKNVEPKILQKNYFDGDGAGFYAELYTAYYELGIYDKALHYLDLLQETGIRGRDETGVKPGNYSLIGEYYYKLGEYSSALEAYKLELNSTKGDSYDEYYIGFLRNNIGQCLYQLGELDSALVFYEEAKKHYISSRKNDLTTVKHLEGFVNSNIADVYVRKKNYKDAIPLYLSTVDGSRKIDFNGKLDAYSHLALCYHKLNNPLYNLYLDSAQMFLDHPVISFDNKLLISKELASIYSKTGQYRKSELMLRKYIQISDSIAVQKEGKYAEFAVLLGLKDKNEILKDQEIELLEKSNVELENNQLRSLLWVIGIIALIIFIAISIIIRLQRRLRYQIDARRKLAEEDSRKKETMLREIHHRVKNNLQVVSGILQIHSNSSNDQKLKDSISDGISRIQTIGQLHNILYRDENKEQIQMCEYLQEIVQLNSKLYQNSAEIELDCDEIELPIERAMSIGLILNELITNSFKHAFRDIDNPKIEIKLKHNKDYQFSYKDNGIGFEGESASANSLGLKLIGLMAGRINAEKTTCQNGISLKF